MRSTLAKILLVTLFMRVLLSSKWKQLKYQSIQNNYIIAIQWNVIQLQLQMEHSETCVVLPQTADPGSHIRMSS